MTKSISIAALAFASAMALAAPAEPKTPADVTVVVENLRSAEGEIRVALWSDPAGFTKPEAAVAETGQKARVGRVTFRFAGLPPGRYAVASFHDENGNGSFDRTLLGLPKEGLGFSNDAQIRLGPPAFEDAAVDITEPDQVIVIRLRY